MVGPTEEPAQLQRSSSYGRSNSVQQPEAKLQEGKNISVEKSVERTFGDTPNEDSPSESLCLQREDRESATQQNELVDGTVTPQAADGGSGVNRPVFSNNRSLNRGRKVCGTLLERLREHTFYILILAVGIFSAYLLNANQDLRRQAAENERKFLAAEERLQSCQNKTQDLEYKLGWCQATEKEAGKSHKDLLEEKERGLDHYKSELSTCKDNFSRNEKEWRRCIRQNENLANEGVGDKIWSAAFGRKTQRAQIDYEE